MGMNWAPAPFAATHKWDRNFFLLMVMTIWLGVLMGFVPEIVHHIQQGHPPEPTIVRIHGTVFVTWLCLLTVQVLLIRSKRLDLHRRLGVVGFYLYPAVVVLGLAASVVVDRRYFGTPDFDPGFLSIQLADMLSFAVLAGAALWLRKTPSAHKRLMLLATIFICDAGFARWWGDGLIGLLGHNYGGLLAALYLGDILLVALLGIYDLATRGRLHPVYIFGAGLGLGAELIAIWLYTSPWWTTLSTTILGL